jgi:hypothetical protein
MRRAQIMRASAVVFSILLGAVTTHAQTVEAAEGSNIQIVKYSWSKERIDWEKTPFGGTVEGFNDTRGRLTLERRGRVSALEERQTKERQSEKEKPAPPPRYVFSYKLTVRNLGPKAIKEIDWDYVFTDEATGEELGRREFTSVEKIGPARQKDLSVLVSSAPTKRISVYTLGKKERDGVVEKINVVRILYDDGSVWQAPLPNKD